MNILNCEQGSEQWLGARLGKPTGSMFGNIVTATGKPVTGAKRASYMAELLGERLRGVDALNSDHFVNAAMERGTELEPEARAWYEEKTGNRVDEIGFMYALDNRCGVSPDGIVSGVGIYGGVEIKCPTHTNHIKHLIADAVPSQWIVQIHGCIWACNREWWDFVCYSDQSNIPSMIKRVERDEVMCDAFDKYMPAFCDELDALELQIVKKHGLEKKEIDLDVLNPVCMTEEMMIDSMDEMEVSEL